MIYVIADDLTGAADTGVQFSKNGYKTVLFLLNGTIPHFDVKNIDVLVVDSETRDISVINAKERIRHLLSKLKINEDDIVYKKVDSTLRGNIGAEIEEFMKVTDKDICIFSPSLPLYKRVTIGGVLFVDEKPLILSEYYNGSKALLTEESLSISYLLQKQTDLPIAEINISDVEKGKFYILKKLNNFYKEGKKIIIVDSKEEHHLHDILTNSLKFSGSVLYSGSAGLAGHFSDIYPMKRCEKIYTEKYNGPVLIIGGSRNKLMISQINYLKKREDIYELTLDLESIFENRKSCLEKYLREVLKNTEIKRHLIIYPSPKYLEKKIVDQLIEEQRVSFRELEILIRNFLGELTTKILNAYLVKKLVIIGGDTAYGVCSALGLFNFKLLNELLPGIPLSIGRIDEQYNVSLITKAGGFGKIDTLYRLIEKIGDQIVCKSQ